MRRLWRSDRRPGSRPTGCHWRWWPRQPPHRDGCRRAASENRPLMQTQFLSAGRRASRLTVTQQRPRPSRPTPTWMRDVRTSLLSPLSGGGVQDEFLQAPFDDFGGQNLVWNPAIDAMHRAELSLLFARDAELAQDRAVEFHLEDLPTGLVQLGGLVVMVGIGGVEILGSRSGRDAQRPGRADVVERGLVIQIVVEHHDALVAAAAPVDIALGIHDDGMQQVELAGPRSPAADLFDELAVLVVLGDA